MSYAPTRERTISPVYHTVKAGETLASIGKQYGTSPQKLALLNGVHNPDGVAEGQRLLIRYVAHEQGYNPENTPRVQKASLQSSPRTPRSPETYSDGILAWPTSGGYVISSFGPRGDSFHDGLDIAAPEGTSVFAAHAGTVIYSDNELSGYGNLIILRDPKGLTTIYAHNSKLLVDLGDRVRRGQEISRVGSTGHATGPHLHFEVRTRDSKGRYVAIDPAPLFRKDTGTPVRYRVNERLTPILARFFNF